MTAEMRKAYAWCANEIGGDKGFWAKALCVVYALTSWRLFR